MQSRYGRAGARAPTLDPHFDRLHQRVCWESLFFTGQWEPLNDATAAPSLAAAFPRRSRGYAKGGAREGKPKDGAA